MKALIFLTVLSVIGVTKQLCYTPLELRAIFKEKLVEFKSLGLLKNDGKWSSYELKQHFQAFSKFAEMVKKHNDEPDTKWVGVLNQFSLMTTAEKRSYLGLKLNNSVSMDEMQHSLVKRDVIEDPPEMKDSVDWSHKIPTAKNQGGCGSCWIFGAVAPLEYQINKDSDEIVSLSEQQYLDCVCEEGGGNGCGGGWPTAAYSWTINNNNMIAREDEYDPYNGVDGPCKTDTKTGMGDYRLIGYSYIQNGDEGMEKAVANPKYGVISCAIGVSGSFYSYGDGVYYAEGCSSVNHAVDVVGYGVLDGEQYWNVRNSWGHWWGDNGYIKMRRGHGLNTCAIASHGHIPLVSKGDEGFSPYYENETGKECRDPSDATGSLYRGSVSHTKSGLKCQKWNSQTPNGHSRTPELNIGKGLGDHNYCRNPDGESAPWCYNGESESPRWEICEVPVCRECAWDTSEGTLGFKKAEAFLECETDGNCTGVTCDGDNFCWLNKSPEDEYTLRFGVYIKEENCTNSQIAPSEDAVLVKRDADDTDEDAYQNVTCKWEVKVQGTNIYSKNVAMTQCELRENCVGISCESYKSCWLNMEYDTRKEFTVYVRTCTASDDTIDGSEDPSQFWDDTLGKECREPEDTTGWSYRGTVNHTISGHSCQKWTSQTPNDHSRTPELNVGKGLGDHNYCRNPDGESAPWCYNGESTSPRWEICEVSVCTKCEWEETVVGSVTYRKGGAKKYCLEDINCKAFACRGNEDCWLNYETRSEYQKTMTVYTKKTSCHI